MAITTRIDTGEKVWVGELTAAILKLVAGLGQPCGEMTINVPGAGDIRVGVIEHVRTKVKELIRAWSRTPPKVSGGAAGGEDKDGRVAGGGSGG